MLETTHSADKFPKPTTIGDDDEEEDQQRDAVMGKKINNNMQ
jgi:hypothetical protein